MGTQKRVGTHSSSKPPKYFRSQMQTTPPPLRSTTPAPLGNPLELARRQAVTRLGNIPV